MEITNYGELNAKALRRATKDASQHPEWEHFVNLYRIVHGNNEDLDKPFIRNMRQDDLKRAIINMTALVNAPKF